MCLSIVLMNKINQYLGLSNAVYTIVSLIVAVIVYFVVTLSIGTLNDSEIKQLPAGQKIYKIVKKIKKIW